MDIYAANVMDHYRHPRHRGLFAGADARATLSNSTCGDEISVCLKIEGGTVSRIAFEGRGCAISQAAISMLSETLTGRSREEVLALGLPELEKLVGLPLSRRRQDCALLGLRAIQAALRESDK